MKPAIKSKTLWFNVIGGVIVLLQYLGTIHVIDINLLEGLLVVGNVVLRFITNTAVKGVM